MQDQYQISELTLTKYNQYWYNPQYTSTNKCEISFTVNEIKYWTKSDNNNDNSTKYGSKGIQVYLYTCQQYNISNLIHISQITTARTVNVCDIIT